MLTLLVHQAVAWEIEYLAQKHGFSLSQIIPFEQLAWLHGGYQRRRTYKDDAFDSATAAPLTPGAPHQLNRTRLLEQSMSTEKLFAPAQSFCQPVEVPDSYTYVFTYEPTQ